MERNFAKLHSDVCFKKSNGKVIWQPRIDCWIADKMFEHGELPGIYKGMSKVDIYKELGCSARIYEYNGCFYPVYDETVKHHYEWKDNIFYERIDTPIGTVTQELEVVQSSWAKRTKKWWVCNEEDLKVFTYIEQHTDWRFSREHFDRTKAEWGDLGAPCVFIPRVSIQRLYIDLMGVEEGADFTC